MNSVLHILRINEVKGFKIYCVFSNGEYRYIDIEKYLTGRELKPNSPLKHLRDIEQVKLVTIENATLTWPEIKHTTELPNGMKFEVALDLDPLVLYEHSEVDTERDSAHQLGRELKQARLSVGITQEELARRVGTSKSYISKIENSKADIGYKTLRKIIDVGLNKRIVIE